MTSERTCFQLPKKRKRVSCQALEPVSVNKKPFFEQTATKAVDPALVLLKSLKQKDRDLLRTIKTAAQTVYDFLGAGLTESVYRDALIVELGLLDQSRFRLEKERIVPIEHSGEQVGFGRADIIVHDSLLHTKVVIELKAVSGKISVANVQQISAYMQLLNVENGVLINFVQGQDSELHAKLTKSKSEFIHVDDINRVKIECRFVQRGLFIEEN